MGTKDGLGPGWGVFEALQEGRLSLVCPGVWSDKFSEVRS